MLPGTECGVVSIYNSLSADVLQCGVQQGDRGLTGERGLKGIKGDVGDPGTPGQPVSDANDSFMSQFVVFCFVMAGERAPTPEPAPILLVIATDICLPHETGRFAETVTLCE